MTVPVALRRLLEGSVAMGAKEQAFLLITVDEPGFPHACLLSRNELAADAGEIRAAIRGRRTRAHLQRERRATLLAVGGTEVHSCSLAVRRSLLGEPFGVAFELVRHEVDSIGVPLEPIRFRADGVVARADAWDQSAAVLVALADQPRHTRGPHG